MTGKDIGNIGVTTRKLSADPPKVR